MHLEWILHPAAPYAVIAPGLGLCLCLFVSLKRDLRVCDARRRKSMAAFESQCNARMESLEERWRELARVSGLLVPPAPPRSGLNLTKRSQALMMFKRGETAREISAALSIPQNEVELLVKVQRMVLSGLGAPV